MTTWNRLGLLLAFTATASLSSAATNDATKKSAAADPIPRADDDTPKFRAARAPDKAIVFKTTPQAELKLQFYFPPGWAATDRRPAMLFWFGGGFSHGTPEQFYWQAEYFASRGLVTASAEYRVKRVHGTLVDKCAEDAHSAIRWVKGHASELGIAPDKVIASGGSAGATLSLLAAVANGPDAPDDNITLSTRPCALVLFNPALGGPLLRAAGEGTPEQAMMKAKFEALTTPPKNAPPAIFFYGVNDAVFLEQAREFARRAHAQGARCEVWIAENNRHGFFNRPPWHEVTARKADEFLAALGYLQGPPKIGLNSSAKLVRTEPASSSGP
jgi:acetyl esterase